MHNQFPPQLRCQGVNQIKPAGFAGINNLSLLAHAVIDGINNGFWRCQPAGFSSLDQTSRGIHCQRLIDQRRIDRRRTNQKYIKIGRVSDHSSGRMSQVWAFVVNTDDDKKFKRGDVLKAAGFNAPARNAPRGNVLDGGFNINWTGPEYL